MFQYILQFRSRLYASQVCLPPYTSVAGKRVDGGGNIRLLSNVLSKLWHPHFHRLWEEEDGYFLDLLDKDDSRESVVQK